MRFVLVLAFALAGCYRPEIGSCFLACGANGTCPDGLECNGQNMCAASANATCDDVPDGGGGGDAEIDAPPGVPTTITIDVVNAEGVGLSNVRIVFASPGGQLIREERTASDGRVVATDIPTGSSATIIRDMSGTLHATTHTDLWEDAQIVSRFSASMQITPIDVSWAITPDPSLTFYPIHTCSSGSFNTTALTWGPSVSNNCSHVDVIVLARDSGGMNRYVASAANVDVANQSIVTIPSMDWMAVSGTAGHNLTFDNLPGGVHSLQLSGYRTPALAYTSPFVQAPVPTSGNVGLVRFPTQIPAVLAVNMTTAGYEQLYLLQLTGATTHVIDMTARKFPWLDDAALDPTSKRLTIPVITDVGATYAQPSVVYTKLGLVRGGLPHVWHIIAPGSRLDMGGMMATLNLPEIPGDNAFEPDATIASSTEEVILLAVPPGNENIIRAGIESHEEEPRFFGNPDLTYILKASSL